MQTEGLTYSQAAARLGTSRLSIAGIIERTKNSANPIISGSGRKNGGSQQVKRLGAAKAHARKATKKKPKPRHAGLRALVALSVPIAPKPIPPDEIWQPLDGVTPIAIEQHTEGQCRWIHGGEPGHPWMYCGEPVKPNSVYCAPHTAMAYRELPTVKAKRKETA